MSDQDLGRIREDLAVIRKAMGLRISFGRGMLAVGMGLAVAAGLAAAASLTLDDDRHQAAVFAAIVALGVVGLFVRSRRIPGLDPEMTSQIVLSITIYAVVWVAGCGYAIARDAGPSVGAARTAGLYAVSIGMLIGFMVILVRAAVGRRERYYGFGLAFATLLAGMLLPIFDRHHTYALAHGVMAVGYLSTVLIQWAQLREAARTHAAD